MDHWQRHIWPFFGRPMPRGQFHHRPRAHSCGTCAKYEEALPHGYPCSSWSRLDSWHLGITWAGRHYRICWHLAPTTTCGAHLAARHDSMATEWQRRLLGYPVLQCGFLWFYLDRALASSLEDLCPLLVKLLIWLDSQNRCWSADRLAQTINF